MGRDKELVGVLLPVSSPSMKFLFLHAPPAYRSLMNDLTVFELSALLRQSTGSKDTTAVSG